MFFVRLVTLFHGKSMSDSDNILDHVPLLDPLSEIEKRRITSVAKTIEVSKRQVVIEKESDVQGLWILLDGRLQGIDYTIDGREVGLYFITPGQFFGELSLVDRRPHPEHIIATSASKVLLIPRPVYFDITKIHPQIATDIAAALAARIRGLIKQRTLLTLATPMQRLAAQLIDLAIRENETIRIDFVPTHQEIAMMINASRETVTRAFRTLQSQGVVRRDGNRLILADRARLGELARGSAD
jgi:CRP/FNR family cyclic AMP-dependent transcriptional regulator